MVKKNSPSWKCEICDCHYLSEKEAEECEKQQPKPFPIQMWQKEGFQRTEKADWKVGDVVAFPGSGPLFGKIVRTAVKRHYLVPVYNAIDGREVPENLGLGYSFALFMSEPELKELQDAIALSIEASPKVPGRLKVCPYCRNEAYSEFWKILDHIFTYHETQAMAEIAKHAESSLTPMKRFEELVRNGTITIKTV